MPFNLTSVASASRQIRSVDNGAKGSKEANPAGRSGNSLIFKVIN